MIEFGAREGKNRGEEGKNQSECCERKPKNCGKCCAMMDDFPSVVKASAAAGSADIAGHGDAQ